MKACIEENLEITAVPGPVAGITALVLSGMDTRHYYFEGFLPMETKERKERLSVVSHMTTTTILYEAPHRLLRTLSDLASCGNGQRRAACCRELTKRYEEVVRGTIDELISHFEEVPPKGEFVIILEGAMEGPAEVLLPEERVKRIRELAEQGLLSAGHARAVAGLQDAEKSSYSTRKIPRNRMHTTIAKSSGFSQACFVLRLRKSPRR